MVTEGEEARLARDRRQDRSKGQQAYPRTASTSGFACLLSEGSSQPKVLQLA
jgi:hypothetical protein